MSNENGIDYYAKGDWKDASMGKIDKFLIVHTQNYKQQNYKLQAICYLHELSNFFFVELAIFLKK